MQGLFELISGVAWERVVMVLLHSLWQGALLALLTWVFLRNIPAARARLRYGVALMALLAVLVSAMASFDLLGHWSTRAAGLGTVPMGVRSASQSPAEHAVMARSSLGPAQAAPQDISSNHVKGTAAGARGWAWAAGLWIAGAVLMLVRAGWLLVGAGRLLRGCRMIDDPRLAGVVEQLRRSMGISRLVRLASGPALRVPAVLGMIVPVVLLPLSVVSEMPVANLRMILAHELAHIRRHDYLVNLLQLLIEAVGFFNPAVWWLSRQVRIEREACCDALAVAATGSGPDYVETLAQVMAGLVGGQARLRLTPALSGEGGILDRVKRLLLPGHRPPVRLPWYTLLGMTILVAILLAGTWRGTQVVVQAAEDLLTPAQRVEKMAELQREIGPEPIGEVETSRDQRDHFDLSGTVRTEDGEPLPHKTEGVVVTKDRHGSAFISLSFDKHQGHFSTDVSAQIAQICVEAPGYAPVASELLQAQGKKYPPVELVLKKGFEGKLRLTGTSGKPVANANISLAYLRPNEEFSGLNRGVFGSANYTTDAEGRIVIPHAADYPARVTVEIHGYEYDTIATRLQPGILATVQLTEAKLTTGIVLDAASRHPLAGATVKFIQRKGFEEYTNYPYGDPKHWDQPPVLATTDDQGRFALDTLRMGSMYVIRISAPDHGSELIQGIQAGQSNLEFMLGPSRPITLQIRADAGQMPKSVDIENPLQLPDCSYDSGFDLPVVEKDGIGEVVLADPLPGTVRFHVGPLGTKGKVISITTDKVNGPLVADLRAEALAKIPQPTTRQVVVKLMWPKDGAEPAGKIRFDYIKPEYPNGYFPVEVQVKDGQASVIVPTPTKFGYSQGGLAGYWIDDKHEIEIPQGDGAFVITIPADPAGMIYGNVMDENGKPFTKYFAVSFFTIKPSPAVGGRQPSLPNTFNANHGEAQYLMSPLPLGGTYRLVAWAGVRMVVSPEITVEANQPIRTLDLKFAAGVSLTGTVLLPKGEPARGLEVDLSCDPSNVSCLFILGKAVTDRDGKFAFEHVDPALQQYHLTVKPGSKTQGVYIKNFHVSDQSVNIQLKAGFTARGRIIDVQTGKPMANVPVRLQPADWPNAQYPEQVEAITNSAGLFEAKGLEAIEYSVNIPDTLSDKAMITRDASGKAISVQENGSAPLIKGGQSDIVEIKRIHSPW